MSANYRFVVNGFIERTHHCLAKALYENTSESPDELSFSKGDIVTVLEQNPGGLEGWWLCTLRGRQGIAPGNRLRLIPGVYDSTGLGYSTASDVSGNNNSVNSSFSLPSTPSLINGSRRRSWHNNSNRVVTPQKIGDVYLYDVPLGTGVTYDVPVSRQLRSSNSSPLPNQVFQLTSQSKSPNSYDTPQSQKIVKSTDHAFTHVINDEMLCSDSLNNDIAKLEVVEAYDVPISSRRAIINEDQIDSLNYDVPPPPTKLVESELLVEICYDVPRSNRSSGIISHVSSSSSLLSPSPQSNCSSLVASTSISSLGDSNRSSFEKPAGDVYDVPPSGNPRRVQLCADISHHDAKSNFSPVAKTCALNMRGTMLSNGYLNCVDDDEVNSTNSAVYDKPKTVSKSDDGNQDLQLNQRISMCSIESKDSATYSTLSTDSVKELKFDLNEGILLMVKYQEQVLGALNGLFALIVDSNWKQKEKLSNTIFGLRDSCHTLSCSLKELLDFANELYINSMNASDKTLSQKMSKLLLQLINSNAIIQNSVTAVDAKGWTVDRLASPGVAMSALNSRTPDELDQLVACSRGLTEDIKHITSFIRSNAKHLFKDSIKSVSEKPAIIPKPMHLRTLPTIPPPAPPRNPNMQSRPLPPLPKGNEFITKDEPTNKFPELIEANEYEYVSLEAKDSKSLMADANETRHTKASLEKMMKESENVEVYSLPQKNITDMEVSTYGRLCDATSLPTIDSLPMKQVPAGDRQMLLFYCAQLESHKCILGHSIDSFIAAINHNQPPKVFIQRSKLVVVAALKLIYIADSIARNVNSELSIAVSKCCNCLCDYLKMLVVNTKKAALQFPSVTAVQEMVDCVVDVSHSANKLFTSLLKMSNL